MSQKIERVKTWNFQSQLSLEEMLLKLNLLKNIFILDTWHERDSEYYGDYLSGYSDKALDEVFGRIVFGDSQNTFRLVASTSEKEWNGLIQETEVMINIIR